jgi:AbrB family looped-hinge helix DNA binding protein
MENNKVIRRIDDLGRVVITKPFRHQLQIREGDPLETWINENGNIEIRKMTEQEVKEYEKSLKIKSK